MHLKSGTLLQGGKYRIEKVLGQGGFGITYLAVQTNLNRKVAIKEFFMKEHCNRDSDTSGMNVPSTGSKELVSKFKAKFIKEAQIIAEMDNPHVVQILDVFEGNGTAYYVMKYISGGSLNDHIRTAGTITADKAVNYIRQVADALMYIHARNVLHLDVKPSNILLNGDTAVLIDFGISKHYDDLGGQTSSTPAGISKGYAPLEQYNQGIQTFSPATDIYSLGATLYRMVTGCVPPEASIVNEDGLPPFPAGLSSDIVKAISKAMEPRRKDRPQTVAEFLALLDVKADSDDEVTDLGPVNGGSRKSGNSGKRTSEKSGKSPKKLILSIAAVLLLCLVGYGIVTSITKKNHQVYADELEYSSLVSKADSLASQCNDLAGAIQACQSAVTFEDRYAGTRYTDSFNLNASDLLVELQNILEQERLRRVAEERHNLEQERERLAQEEAEQDRLEQERLAKEEAEREKLEKERLAQEEAERLRLEQERLARENAEQERLKKERLEKEEAERQRRERERLANEEIERSNNEISYSNGILRVNGVEYPMIHVPGGSFVMGNANEIGQAVHQVTLSSYYIGKYEITQDIWEAVMGSNSSTYKGSRKPVHNLSWNDCQKFINELNKLTGQSFRLPTEAEWEFAARGGINTHGYIYSGSNTLTDVAWTSFNSGKQPHNVGTLEPNELGIYDMSGNVMEWCNDCYGAYPSKPQTNPKGPSVDYNGRVVRGGCFNQSRLCNVTVRLNLPSGYRDYTAGFRICL